MSIQTPQLDQKRLERAKEEIRNYGHHISEEVQAAILAQKVILGMSPHEARLAGGAFTFKVVADSKKWPKSADPYNVMWAQSIEPDDSDIWMTFKTATQYEDEGMQSFQVHFIRGKAVAIKLLKDSNE